MSAALDEVGRFLLTQGFSPRPEYFLASGFLLGYRVENRHFCLTYRQDAARLVVCDFAARGEDAHAVRQVIALMRRIAATVPSVEYIDALILTEPGDPALDRARERLARILIAEGARPVDIDGDLWLRYP